MRIVTWNTEDDISGYGTGSFANRPGTGTVLAGLGEDLVNGIQRAPDIIGLEETASNTFTVAPMVVDLNGSYPSASYVASSYQGTQSGTFLDGNGPNAMVYNQNTVTLLASVGVGTPGGSSNGEYRQVVRYEFEPKNSTNVFYVYVSHAKSGTTSADATSRGQEAAIERTNAATLPVGSSIIYMGDMNTEASTDASVVNFTAATPGPPGQSMDPFNPTNTAEIWDTNSLYQGIQTESVSNLEYRDDLQLVSPNIYAGTFGTGGTITYLPNSLHSFGNNGSLPEHGAVSSGPNTALNYLNTGSYNPTGNAIKAAESTASDHYPVVADYSLAITNSWAVTGGGSWAPMSNWLGAVPQNIGDTANFAGSITNNATIQLNGNWSLGSLNFNNASHSYTIASGTSGVLTLGNGTNAGVINDLAGSHTISAPMTLSSALNVNVASSGTLTISNAVSGTGTYPISMTGPGQLNMLNASAASLTVNSGTLAVIGGGGTVGTSVTSSLTIANGATMDINDHAIVIPYSGSSPIGELTANGQTQTYPAGSIQGYIQKSVDGGLWDNPGLTSSVAANDPFGGTGVGALDQNDLSNAEGQDYTGGTWMGVSITSDNTVLVRETYYGDTDLDGTVGATDVNNLELGFDGLGDGWVYGDFNYDGVVDSQDLNLLELNYASLPLGDIRPLTQAQAHWLLANDKGLTPAQIAAFEARVGVPEPATIGLLGAAAIGLLGRRRR